MKVLFSTNNPVSGRLIDWLSNEAHEDVIIVNDEITKEIIEYHRPDLLVSYNYRHIIKKEILSFLKNKAINLHISLLPCNRGAHPNLWSYLEDTPKGVTIHIINNGIDTGDILLQKKVYVNEQKDTLSSSYKILHEALQELFISNWDKLKNFKIIPKPQGTGGNFHNMEDFKRVSKILGDEGWEVKISEIKKRFMNFKGGN